MALRKVINEALMRKIEKSNQTILKFQKFQKKKKQKIQLLLKILLIVILKIIQEIQINFGFLQQEKTQING